MFHVTLDDTVYWTNKDVLNLFSPFGDVHINWSNQSSFFVSLEKRKEAGKGTAALSNLMCRSGIVATHVSI